MLDAEQLGDAGFHGLASVFNVAKRCSEPPRIPAIPFGCASGKFAACISGDAVGSQQAGNAYIGIFATWTLALHDIIA